MVESVIGSKADILFTTLILKVSLGTTAPNMVYLGRINSGYILSILTQEVRRNVKIHINTLFIMQFDYLYGGY